MSGFSFDPDEDRRQQLDDRDDPHCHICGLSKVGRERMESFGYTVFPCSQCVGDYDDV